MDALIMSCGTGGGHNSACRALASEFASRGHRAEILNPYTLKSHDLAQTVNRAYISLVQKMPSAFGAVYHIGDVYRKLPGSSPVYLVNKRMAPYMERYLAERSFDAILSTHLFPAEILTNMKRHGIKLPPVYFVATDYVCIPFTEETECDRYVVPAPDLAEDFVRRGIDEKRLCPLGIPVDESFYGQVTQEEAKKALGLDESLRYILIAGGSMGAGHMEQAVSLLAEAYRGQNIRLIAVCGNNRDVFERLSEKGYENCTVMEYTDQMVQYMKACDVFVSKPGGLSSTEAAVSGTPLIHMPPIPGCETYNMEYFQRHGMSLAVTNVKMQLLTACDSLLDHREREKMIENQKACIPPRAASSICDLVEQGGIGL